MAALGQQSVEFAHDLRNPLTAMLGYVTLLADELKDAKERLGEQWDETAEYLELIEKSVTRCKELSDLWLHRGKKGDQSRSAVPVRALLNDVILGICHAAEAKHVALELAPAAEDGTILANRVQVYRALQNIALNAVEAAPAHHGVVRLASRVDGDTLVITVADNGCGMDAAQIQRIFEPFYTTKKAAGTGLGLAIAKEAIDEHNGSIDVRSATQQGATFIIRLPLMKMGGALKAEGLALPGGTGLSAPHCTQ
jgi:two-component system NtrC family sensor kinase